MIPQEKSNPILLVDDEEDIREVLSITLEDMGYDVETAENGEKAFELFKSFRFPIVLTDIKMPGMDGIELLKKIKAESPYTEIIMITGHGDMNLAINSFRNEAVEFITKPVDVESLNVAMGRAEEKIKNRRHLFDYTENLERLVYEKTKELKKVKESETDRKEEKADINSVMDNLPLMIFFINRDLKITASNRLFKNKFDESYDFCYSALMLQDNPCDNCPALKCFESRTSTQLEVKFKTGKEKNKSYLVWSSPLEDTEGEVTGAMIIATDINQIVDIQDHLTSLGLMVGSVSHGIKDTSHKISLNCTETQGRVEFLISDNGIGMNETEIENAFTLFHSTKGAKGTGLGLFISDKSIKQHKGTITVNSEKSKGSEFVIRLPVHDPI